MWPPISSATLISCPAGARRASLRRESNRCFVEQVLALGFLRVQIATEAVLASPLPHRYQLLGWPVPRLQLLAADRRGRLGGLYAHASRHELTLRSALLQQVLNRARLMSFDGLLSAYEARVHQIYSGNQR
jgi:hypothetical protein